MARLSERRYQLHIMIAMVVYVAAMLIIWPAVRTDLTPAIKILCALLPVLPVLYVIGIMAWRIRDCDELEQRTHLIGLGAATAVTAVLSLIVGFLAAARIVDFDGSCLMLIFPLMVLCYGFARWRVARRYGFDGECDADQKLPWQWRAWILVAIALVVGISLIFHHDENNVSSAIGMFIGMALAAIGVGIYRWLRKRRQAHSTSDGLN